MDVNAFGETTPMGTIITEYWSSVESLNVDTVV